jgi:O-antigen ligase/tetratricopeptide (TPR) repeat protein
MARHMGNSESPYHPNQLHGIGREMLAAMLLLVPVVFWRGGLEPFELCKVALVQLAALGLVVVAGLAACSRSARRDATSLRNRLAWLVGDPISAAMLVGAFAGLVSTLNSLSPRTSWHGRYENGMGLLTTLALLVVYLAARRLGGDPRNVSRLLWAVALALVAPTLYAFIQMAGLDPFSWEQTSPFAHWTRPFGTLGHPNLLAGYIVMALPLIVWLAWQCLQTGRGRLGLGLCVLALLACVVALASLSRSAWLVLFLDFAGILILGIRRAVQQGGTWKILPGLHLGSSGPWVLAFAGLLVAGIAGAVVAGAAQPILERIRHVTVLAGRGPIWNGAWKIFVDHPWTGCGLETFDLAFRRYGTATFWRLEGGFVPTRAHNDLLHTLATQGLPGLIAFVTLSVSLVWAMRRAWRVRREEDRGLVLALGAAIGAWYVQNCFGFPVAPTASLFVVLAGMLSGLAWPGEPKEALDLRHSPGRRLASLSIVAGGALLAYVLVARPYLAGCACHQGEQMRQGDPEGALLCHERAVGLDPGRDVLWGKLGACAAVAAEGCPDASQRRRLLLRGRAAVEQACRLVPTSSENHANRGRVLRALAREGLAQPEELLAAFDRALTLDPENTMYLADAAAAAVGLGMAARAREYIDLGLRIDPDLGMLHTDMAALELAEGHYRQAEQHLDQALAGRWHDSKQFPRAQALLCLVYLDTERPGQAFHVADDVLAREESLPVRCLRARALEKLGRRREAAEEYRRIVQVRPDHALARAALARLDGGRKNGKSR